MTERRKKPPTIWCIKITRRDGTIHLPQTGPVSLKHGDSVRWHFDLDIPSGFAPGLELEGQEKGPEFKPFGPFAMLAHQGNEHMFGCGFSGDTKTVTYRAGLYPVRGDAPPKLSNYSTLDVFTSMDTPIAPQVVQVTLELVKKGLSGEIVPRLVVEPRNVIIVRGLPLVWQFCLTRDIFGEKHNWYPEVLFQNQALGPFRSISAFAGYAIDPTLQTAPILVAAGINPTVPKGRFEYRAIIRSGNSTLSVEGPDPTVDDEGELMSPPPPGGGGTPNDCEDRGEWPSETLEGDRPGCWPTG